MHSDCVHRIKIQTAIDRGIIVIGVTIVKTLLTTIMGIIVQLRHLL